MKHIIITLACITPLSCTPYRIHTGKIIDKRNDWYMQDIGTQYHDMNMIRTR